MIPRIFERRRGMMMVAKRLEIKWSKQFGLAKNSYTLLHNESQLS